MIYSIEDVGAAGMNRRGFLASGLWTAGTFWTPRLLAQPASAQTPIAEPHFPNRLYQFVWRNWELANMSRMADVVHTSPENLLKLARQMGLPPKPQLTPDQLRRIYILVIRQNWHLLPVSQLIQLLGWTRAKFEFTLKEDDFLGLKLGPKPDCAPLQFAEPRPAERRRAEEIRRILISALGRDLDLPGEPAFHFVETLTSRQSPWSSELRTRPSADQIDLRYLYSYFALYGDPLMEEDIDPLPDGYMEKLARTGVNGVWLQCVLNTLAPSPIFPEFGNGCEIRLRNLGKLVQRAKAHAVRLYLYLNEPRAMPPQFYQKHPDMKGAESEGYYAMCTNVPAVRQWISDSLTNIFERVPELGGVFSITMSENLTNCFSQEHPETCPRCSKREAWKAVGEVLDAIHTGVRRSSRDADVIVWDWGWPDQLCQKLIPTLPSDTRFLSVSEWSMPIERGGVKTEVGEYSISVVGPGPRAIVNWKLARAAGMSTMAKVQFNNTWEISAVPYIPVANLISRHCHNLVRSGVRGWMMSWTLGGYPSPNLEIAKEFCLGVAATEAEVLQRIASRRYGDQAAPLVLEAWKGFSDAFEQYPYSVDIYTIPTQHGPANLLRVSPTGVKSSMILFPQDDYKNWSGQYPPEVVRDQFAKMASLWENALPVFRRALDSVPGPKRSAALEDLAIATTCGIHFRSTANQIEFYLLRDSPRTRENLERMRALAEQEIDLARRLYILARQHSVIAFEASNHYYYRPTDLLEKVVNCRYVLDQILVGARFLGQVARP